MPQGEFFQAEEVAHYNQENENDPRHVRVDVYEENSRGLSDSSATPGHMSSSMGEIKAQKILHS